MVGDGLGEIPTLLSLGQGREIPLPLASGLRGKCPVVASSVSAFIWGFSFVEILLPALSLPGQGGAHPTPDARVGDVTWTVSVRVTGSHNRSQATEHQSWDVCWNSPDRSILFIWDQSACRKGS